MKVRIKSHIEFPVKSFGVEIAPSEPEPTTGERTGHDA